VVELAAVGPPEFAVGSAPKDGEPAALPAAGRIKEAFAARRSGKDGPLAVKPPKDLVGLGSKACRIAAPTQEDSALWIAVAGAKTGSARGIGDEVQRLPRLDEGKALSPEKHDCVGLSNDVFLAPRQVTKANGPWPGLQGVAVGCAQPAEAVAVAPKGSFRRALAQRIRAKAGSLEGTRPNDSRCIRCGNLSRPAAPDRQGRSGEDAEAPRQGGRALEARPPGRGSAAHRVGVAKKAPPGI
jgi:hypothetical protein